MAEQESNAMVRLSQFKLLMWKNWILTKVHRQQ